MQQALITICARSDSGVTGEQYFMRKVRGKEMPLYSFSAARIFEAREKAIHVDYCLNTDCEELIDLVQRRYPDTFIIRREGRLADVSVPKEDVYRDSLLKAESRFNKKYDFLIDLDITSPFRRSFDIPRAVDLFLSDPDADAVMSCVKSRRNPFYNMAMTGEGGYASRVIQNEFTYSLQAPSCFDINASIYVVSRDFLINEMIFDLWQGKIRLYEMKDVGILRMDRDVPTSFADLIASYCYDTDDGYKEVFKI